MRKFALAALLLVFAACGAKLPPGVADKARASLDAAKPYAEHVWRDMAPLNADGTVNGYIEIPRGESSKWEFRIPLNRREIDRTIPAELGGYPINYGFMPQTVSYDGDPADVLVAGPPIDGGTVVRGTIIGFMRMMDSGDLDSKVIISPLDERGKPRYTIDAADRERMARFFSTYKQHEGKSTSVPGWGDEAEARAFIKKTSGFFQAALNSRR